MIHGEFTILQCSKRWHLTTLREGDAEAGLSVYQIHDGHLDLFVSKKQVALRCKLKSIDYVVKSVPRLRKDAVKLRISSDGEMYRFAYSFDGKKFHDLGSMNCSLMSTEVILNRMIEIEKYLTQ